MSTSGISRRTALICGGAALATLAAGAATGVETGLLPAQLTFLSRHLATA
jgi:hypothetical protein